MFDLSNKVCKFVLIRRVGIVYKYTYLQEKFMDAFLREWEEFVNIATIGNEVDKRVLSRVKPLYKNGKFFILVRDDFTKAWIEKNYLDRIVSAFRYYDVEVEILLEKDADQNDIKNSQVDFGNKSKGGSGSLSSASVAKGGIFEKVNGSVVVMEKEEVSAFSNINPRYTFENFVVGPSNDFAYHSALNVSRYPGKSYNPLFIYGGVGLGKTHLLHAIANEIQKEKKTKKVIYITSEQFTNEFFKALNSKTLNSFRIKYREADILLIDDVQFFKSSMKQAIEELFHTFNKLAHDKKQMVFTSDRSPRELEEIGDRMISRFEGGLVVEIKKPEFETRMKIVELKLRSENIDIDEELKYFIAKNITDSVRSLESAVNRISAFLSFKKGKLTMDVLKALIKDLLDNNASDKEVVGIVYTIDDIVKAVAKYYNTTPENIIEGNRKEDLAFARQVAIYLAKKLTNLTFSQIAERFGRVHSTAVRAYERVDSLIKRDFLVKEQIKDILLILKKSKSV